jgi:hypothetical protein
MEKGPRGILKIKDACITAHIYRVQKTKCGKRQRKKKADRVRGAIL